MNTRNVFKMRLLAMTVWVVILSVPVFVFAQQKVEKAEKQKVEKQKAAKSESQKVEKQKAESGKSESQKTGKSESQKGGKSESQKAEKAESQKGGKSENQKAEKSENQKGGKSENQKTGKAESQKGGKSEKSESQKAEKAEKSEKAESQKESKEQSKKQKTVDAALVSVDDVPVAVVKAYKKRYASASDPVWNFYKDKQLYKVNCVYRGVVSQISFTNEGTWIETTEELSVDKLPASCLKTIDMYYQNYKMNSLKRLTTSTKNDMFIVGLFENKNIKKKLETTIYLELSGAYIRAEDPIDATEEKTVVETDKVEKKQEKEKESKKTKKKFEKEMYIDDDAPIKLDGNELPPSVQKWVSKNYPEYIYKEVTYGEYDEFENEGRIYQIVIQRTGINQPHATVWFTRDGNFLKLEDNFRENVPIETVEDTPTEAAKEKTPKESKEPKAPKENEKKTAKENEKKNTKDAPVKDEPAGYSVEETDVKKEIITAFKTKYPRAKNVSWIENEDVEWTVSFTDQYGENTAVFSDKSNEWAYTKTLLPDINKIPATIRNFVAKNYPKKQVMKGWMIKSPNAKPYYTVELYTKKGKLTEYIDFLQNGKIKE